MKKIAIIFLSACLMAGCDKPSDEDSVFQLRLVVNSQSSDSEEMTVPYNNSEQKYYVQKTPLLDDNVIESAKASHDVRNNPSILINFTSAGAKRLAEITRQHIGDRLAIVIDGKLVFAPEIRAEIDDGKAEVAGIFNESETEALAKKINDAIIK